MMEIFTISYLKPTKNILLLLYSYENNTNVDIYYASIDYVLL